MIIDKSILFLHFRFIIEKYAGFYFSFLLRAYTRKAIIPFLHLVCKIDNSKRLFVRYLSFKTEIKERKEQNMKNYIKWSVSRDFRPSVFFMIRTHLGP